TAAEGALTTIADSRRPGGRAGRQPQYAIIISGEHMRTTSQGGWGKKEIRQFLFDHTQNSIAHLKRTNRVPGAVLPADETKMRPIVASPDDFLVIAAGGRAGPFAAHIPGWGGSRSSLAVTKEGKR